MMQGSVSNRVRLLRFLNGEMSQAELGQRIGVTRQTIAAIEAGKYSPTLEAAFRIADVFQVPLEEAFQWNSNGAGSQVDGETRLALRPPADH
jgi:putative transcriptional regulator